MKHIKKVSVVKAQDVIGDILDIITEAIDDIAQVLKKDVAS